MRKVEEINRTYNLVSGWWKRKIMCRDEFLKEDDNDDQRQPGGVSLISNDKITQHIVDQGVIIETWGGVLDYYTGKKQHKNLYNWNI